MVASERNYNGTNKFRKSALKEDTNRLSYDRISHPSCSYDQAQLYQSLLNPIEKLEDHTRLRDALINNSWSTYGDAV